MGSLLWCGRGVCWSRQSVGLSEPWQQYQSWSWLSSTRLLPRSWRSAGSPLWCHRLWGCCHLCCRQDHLPSRRRFQPWTFLHQPFVKITCPLNWATLAAACSSSPSQQVTSYWQDLQTADPTSGNCIGLVIGLCCLIHRSLPRSCRQWPLTFACWRTSCRIWNWANPNWCWEVQQVFVVLSLRIGRFLQLLLFWLSSCRFRGVWSTLVLGHRRSSFLWAFVSDSFSMHIHNPGRSCWGCQDQTLEVRGLLPWWSAPPLQRAWAPHAASESPGHSSCTASDNTSPGRRRSLCLSFQTTSAVLCSSSKCCHPLAYLLGSHEHLQSLSWVDPDWASTSSSAAHPGSTWSHVADSSNLGAQLLHCLPAPSTALMNCLSAPPPSHSCCHGLSWMSHYLSLFDCQKFDAITRIALRPYFIPLW